VIRFVEVFLGLLIGALVFGFFLNKSPDFIEIHEINVRDDVVFVDRSIHGVTPSNWAVDVFNDRQGKICSGNSDGEHTYRNSPRKTAEFSIDVYVGDEGCSERLIDGYRYTMTIEWIPSDVEISPVYHWLSFTQ